MRIILTNHAKEQMVKRGIKIGDIRKTLKNPRSISPSLDDTIVARGKTKESTLKVVYKTKGVKTYIIITAYYAN